MRRRLQAIEDRLQILNLLAGALISADTGDADYQRKMYSPEALMDRDGDVLQGGSTLASIMLSTDHQAAITDGMAHIGGPWHICLRDSEATAVGYVQILVSERSAMPVGLGNYAVQAGLRSWRLTANRWELAKNDGAWQIVSRIIRAAPSTEARALLCLGGKLAV